MPSADDNPHEYHGEEKVSVLRHPFYEVLISGNQSTTVCWLRAHHFLGPGLARSEHALKVDAMFPVLTAQSQTERYT